MLSELVLGGGANQGQHLADARACGFLVAPVQVAAAFAAEQKETNPAISAQARDEQRRLGESFLRKTDGKERIAPLREEMHKNMEACAGIYRTGAELTVGWTGSNTTLKYLSHLIPVLERIFDQVPFKLRVVGGSEMELDTKIPVELVRWSSM